MHFPNLRMGFRGISAVLTAPRATMGVAMGAMLLCDGYPWIRGFDPDITGELSEEQRAGA